MKSSADGFNEFLKTMLSGVVEEKQDGSTRLGKVIEELKHKIKSDFEETKKGFRSKCDCLSCRCMLAVEKVIDEEVKAKGKEYQQQEQRIEAFKSIVAGQNARNTAIAVGNTASTFYDILGDLMKKHCIAVLADKIATEKGYMKI